MTTSTTTARTAATTTALEAASRLRVIATPEESNDAPERGMMAVHDGQFHMDDCLAAVIIAVVFGFFRVLRTRNAEWLEEAKQDPSCIVADVGGEFDPERGLFDHHQQQGVPCWPDGTKRAAAGLLWEVYGYAYLREVGVADSLVRAVKARVSDRLIRSSDRIDNGNWEGIEGLPSVSDIVLMSNTGVDPDSGFLAACRVAAFALDAAVRDAVAYCEEREELHTAAEGQSGPALALPHPFANWGELITGSSQYDHIKYVVWEGKGQWEARGVPPRPWDRRNIMKPEVPFPPAWRGLAGPKLAETSGVADAKFCHVGGFFACASSLEGAVALAEAAIAAAS